MKTGPKPIDPVLRFWPKVDKSGDCWLWTARVNPHHGYGQFSLNQRQTHAHIASYRMFVGPIPKGMFVLHKCDVRACVKPDHLFIGTKKDNTRDMMSKGRSYPIPKIGPEDIVRLVGQWRAFPYRGGKEGFYATEAKRFGCGPENIARVIRQAVNKEAA